MPGIDDSDQDHGGPSLHSIKQKAAAAAWEKNSDFNAKNLH